MISVIEKLECNQNTDRVAAVSGSKQANKDALTGPTILIPCKKRVNAPMVPIKTMIPSDTIALKSSPMGTFHARIAINSTIPPISIPIPVTGILPQRATDLFDNRE